jgi:hypothetical protein
MKKEKVTGYFTIVGACVSCFLYSYGFGWLVSFLAGAACGVLMVVAHHWWRARRLSHWKSRNLN